MAPKYSLSLRARTLVTILAVLVPGTAAFLAVVNLTMRSSFDQLEHAEARKDVERCVQALASEVEAVERVATDYAQWDDSYEFMVGRSEEFVSSNLTVAMYVINKLDVVWYVGLDGVVTFGTSYDRDTKEAQAIPELPTTPWPSTHPLLNSAGPRSVSGFLATSRGTLIVATHPITASDASGAPRGTLVMGRFLTAAKLAELGKRVGVDFEILPVGEIILDSGGLAELEAGGAALRDVSDLQIDAFRLVRDVRGRPLAVVRAKVAREIAARGRAAALSAGLYGLLIALAILLALYRFFGRSVVRPVTALGDCVRSIAADLGRARQDRVPVERRDELGRLAEDVNVLLSSLDETRSRLEEARVVAESASAAKGRFVAHMSHELRTPINGILGMTAALLRSGLDADQRRCAETVKICSDTLLAMVGDVLDLAKIEAGRVEVESIPFAVEDLLTQAVAVVGHVATAKGLELRTEVVEGVPPRIQSDPTRILQVLVNLIGNAVKFTATGEISLRVDVADEAGSGPELLFVVTDTGIGVPPDRLPLLFKPFQQGESSTNRRFGGTGLGLAISRGIVDALGGRMGATSEVGHGATFWFTIPLVEAPPLVAIASGSALPSRAPIRRLRILLAEDNLVNQEVARRMLEALGHEVRLVADGAEAIRVVATDRFDLVLMDVQMPHVDGYEATSAIRLREREVGARRQRIVALTASATVGERERCMEVGMDQVLSKPIQLEQLEALLRRTSEAAPPDGSPPPGTTSSPTLADGARAPSAFDLSSLGLPADRSAELAFDVAGLFLTTVPGTLVRLREAVAAGDYERLALEAHTLKGTCLNLRARDAVTELAALEAAARSRDVSTCRAWLAAIEASIAVILLEAEALHATR